MLKWEINAEQKEAVLHRDGPMLVLAGAGSGKTRVVTYRIAQLLQDGVPPSEIVAVTFTNKAAEEMRHRIEGLTHTQILTTTFHALSARILRESIHLIGFPTPFSIYDEKDSLDLLKTMIEKAKEMKEAISDAKSALLGPEAFPHDKPFQKVYAAYQEALRGNRALDFDDLLVFCVRVLQHPDSPYQTRWRYILVDEYQDTNQAQYTICRLLTEKHGNLFVVGDPDQSIYSWRGADIGNILRFEHDFPGAKVVTLQQNYRSTNAILQAANAVIANNDRRYDKELWSRLGDGEKISLHKVDTDLDEARLVVRNIRYYLAHYDVKEIAVLMRTNAQTRVLEDQFLMAKIPYTIIGGLSFYARKEVKDILSYLRLMIIPSDTVAFERTINTPKRGMGPKALAKTGGNLLTLKERLHEFSPKQQRLLQDYLSIFQQTGATVHETIQNVIDASQYDAYLREDKESYEERKANIDELVAKAYEWEKTAEQKTLIHFLEDLALNTPRETTEEGVRLMTLHHAKGLEFEVVFIIGIEENLFPHIHAKKETDVDEERRLITLPLSRLLLSQWRFAKAKQHFPKNILILLTDKELRNCSLDSLDASTPRGKLLLHLMRP